MAAINYTQLGFADICRITNHPTLSSITKSHCLTFFGHLAWLRMQNYSHFRTSSRELEATTWVAVHNSDEHS